MVVEAVLVTPENRKEVIEFLDHNEDYWERKRCAEENIDYKFEEDIRQGYYDNKYIYVEYAYAQWKFKEHFELEHEAIDDETN